MVGQNTWYQFNCRLGAFSFAGYPCAAGLQTNTSLPIAVAILNSEAHFHVDTEGAYADFSNCENSFRLRYALGIHKAKHDDLERFQSRGRNHNYVSFKQSLTY